MPSPSRYDHCAGLPYDHVQRESKSDACYDIGITVNLFFGENGFWMTGAP